MHTTIKNFILQTGFPAFKGFFQNLLDLCTYLKFSDMSFV